MKKILCTILSIVMIAGMLPASAFAAEPAEPRTPRMMLASPKGGGSDYTEGDIIMAPAAAGGVSWPEDGMTLFEYDIQHDTIGMFNVVYIPHVGGSGTSRTVLAVTWPEYGTKCTSAPSPGANGIRSISFPDNHTAIIELEDNITEQSTYGFTIAADNLSDEQAGRWIDGEDMTTGYTAIEYRLNEGYTVSSTVTLADLQSNATAYAAFIGTPAVPKEYETPSIAPTSSGSYLHTYHVGVSTIPANLQSTLGKIGDYWSNDGYLLGGSKMNGELRWDIPTVHSSETPLIEITSIRIYVPHENLKLTGLRATGTLNGYRSHGRDLDGEDFSQQWTKWVIGERMTDSEGHSYYDITPPSRWFNTGVGKSLDSEFYGFIPNFQLIDEEAGLPYSDTQETHFYAPDTVITYKQAGVSGEQTFTQEGPEIYTWIRKTTEPSTAYNAVRFKNRNPASDQNVIIGSSRLDEVFTYFNNQYHVNTTTGQKTEWIPSHTGPVTMHYDFPVGIQPFKVRFTYGYSWLKNNGRSITGEKELGALRYTTADGVTHNVPDEEIAAANERFASTAYVLRETEGHEILLLEATETNRIVSLDIEWNKLYVSNRFTYANGGYNGVVNNTASNGKLNSESASLLSVGFSYLVFDEDENGDPVQQYSTTQVKYRMSSGEISDSNDNWLWFRMKNDLCPSLRGSYRTQGSFNGKYLDGREDNIGYVSLYVGHYGEYMDELVNPVIDLKMWIKSNQYPKSGTNNTNMPDEDALAFFTGRFTAMPKLSGWDCEYTTLRHPEGLSYTIPEITDEAGQTVQIPLEEGDYFKTLSLHYDGTAVFPHTGPTDERTSYILMDNITIRRIATDPFTGTPIQRRDVYGGFYVALYGYLRFDNCGCDTRLHSEGIGQLMNSADSTTLPTNQYYPEQLLFRNRTAAFTYDGIIGAITEKNVSQGQSTSFSYVPRIIHNASDRTRFNYNYSLNPNPEDGNQRYPMYLPIDISYAAYVELTDDDFTVDLSQTTYLGVPVSSGNVIAEEITVTDGEGKDHRFLKLSFADGFIQPKVISSYQSGTSYRPSTTTYPGFLYGNGNTYCGCCFSETMQIGLTALPSASIGEHYPIGKVYYDFSELLEKYDAPNITGNVFPEDPYSSDNDYNMTNYTFTNAVPDEYGLTTSITAETDKLFVSDFSKGSATAQKVIVSIAAVTGADGYPGKNGTYDVAGRVTDFTQPAAEELNGLMVVKGSATNPLTDYVTWVKLPRAGRSVDYTDESGDLTAVTSDITLQLRGPITRINKNGVADADLSVVYTTDEDPTESSAYVTAASVTDWSAVTGFKVTAANMKPEGAITLYMDLRSDSKDSLEVLHAYMGGRYTYKLQGLSGDGLLGLSTWNYINIPVTGSTGGIVYWDTYNENGIKSTGTGNDGKCETGIGGIPVSLYDADDNLIMSTVTSTDSADLGQFALETYKSQAGQYIVIGEPTVEGVEVKLTKNSQVPFYLNRYDSDFDRNIGGKTHTLTLPELPASGYGNIGAGFVKLPKLSAKDVTIYVGETADISAQLTYYLGMALPADSYNITFEAAADEGIAQVSAVSRVITTTRNNNNSNARTANDSTAVTGMSAGDTTARIYTVTALGDTVETLCNIHVIETLLTVRKTVAGNAGDRSRAFEFTIKLNPAISGTYSGVEFTDGVAVVHLADGESRTISGLPEGIAYTVTEADCSGEGYVTTQTGDTGIISSEKEQIASFVNTRNVYGNLRISKTVAGDTADEEKYFTFKVEFDAEGTFNYTGSASGTIKSGEAVQLKHGESITIQGIPSGTAYKVRESGNRGYRVNASGDAGIIPEDETAEAKFTNIKSSTPFTGDGFDDPLWLCLMGASVLGMVGASVKGRKGRKRSVN